MGRYYYISLVRALLGYCIRVKANSEDDVRKYAAKYLGKIWCSVYDTSEGMTIIGETVNLMEGVE